MELGVTCVGFVNDVEVAVDKERGKGNLKKSLHNFGHVFLVYHRSKL